MPMEAKTRPNIPFQKNDLPDSYVFTYRIISKPNNRVAKPKTIKKYFPIFFFLYSRQLTQFYLILQRQFWQPGDCIH